MKKFFKQIIFALGWMCFLATPVFAFSANQFQYVSSIEINEPTYNGPIWLPINQDVRQAASVHDLRIINDSNEEIAYAIFTELEEKLATNLTVSETSSTRMSALGSTYGPENMLDGDIDTYFEPDYALDHGNSFLILDFGEPQFTEELHITPTGTTTHWESLTIDISSDGKFWRQIKSIEVNSKDKLKTDIQYPQTLGQYMRITVYYGDNALEIAELEVYGTTDAKLLFEAESDKEYWLYYGSVASSPIEYDTSHLYTTIDTPTATLGEKEENSAYEPDLDGDDVLNTLDNCLFTENSDQADADNDSLGDICDNAPNDRNRSQLDFDEDGVGDDADNCRLYKNPDQLDDDLDGIGWVCDDDDSDGVINSVDNCVDMKNYNQSDVDGDTLGDACDESDERFTEQYRWLLWGVIGFATAILLGFAYRMVTHK